MLKVPNEEAIRNLVNKIEEEYDLENRLNRYKTQSELVELASNQGLTDIDDAIRALFVTDFVVTASELPSGGTDEDRYRSIINSFKKGQSRCPKSDLLMRIFYLAYKTATSIRRQDLFMAGRGLQREAALIRLKDSYILPYLSVVSETLGEGSSGWELGVLSAALKRMYPDNEIQQLDKVPEYTDYKTITEYIWRLLESYSQKQIIETNPNPIIPNLNESKSILILDIGKTNLISLWNTTPSNVSQLKIEFPSLGKFLNQPIDGKQLISIRASILDTMEHFFIIRDPFITSKPMFIMKTPADEINLSYVLTILHSRGLEQDSWKSILVSKENFTSKVEEAQVKEIEETPIDKTEHVVTQTQEEKEQLPKVRKGLFTRIKEALFGTKTTPTIEERPVPKNLQVKPKKKAKKVKKRDPLELFIDRSSFIAQGITVDAVGDLNLFELFDTFREENYYVVGTFEADFEKAKTNFLVKPENTLPSAVVTFFINLYQEMSKVYANCFDDHQVLVEELFFISEDGQKMIITLNGNQERVVGTIANTFIDKIGDWQSRGVEVEGLQRRSLHMRTKQLLAARRHTPFDEALGRIYGANLDTNKVESITLDQLIFSLS